MFCTALFPNIDGGLFFALPYADTGSGFLFPLKSLAIPTPGNVHLLSVLRQSARFPRTLLSPGYCPSLPRDNVASSPRPFLSRVRVYSGVCRVACAQASPMINKFEDGAALCGPSRTSRSKSSCFLFSANPHFYLLSFFRDAGFCACISQTELPCAQIPTASSPPVLHGQPWFNTGPLALKKE